MFKPSPSKITLLILASLMILLNTGCQTLGKRAAMLIYGEYSTPIPYITPVAQGTPHFLVTPYPEGTPVYDVDLCYTEQGSLYEIDAASLYYSFQGLLKKAGDASRQELTPIIDEMRTIHEQFRALEPPPECELLVELDYAYEAEIDQTLRAFIAFRNGEPEEIWQGYYFNEALFYDARVKELLRQIH